MRKSRSCVSPGHCWQLAKVAGGASAPLVRTRASCPVSKFELALELHLREIEAILHENATDVRLEVS